MKIGIVVLSWNSRAFIDDCLSGLMKFERDANVYVVDNDSHDGSAEHITHTYPNLSVIRSQGNLGFAGGNNLGIAQALRDGCDAVALLNNDTVIDEHFTTPCAALLRNDAAVGIVGPVIVDSDNPTRIQCAGGRISPWTLRFEYIRAGLRYERTAKCESVDYVLGAAMIIRREVLEKTGGFDEEYYPAYVEEADMCYRAAVLGYRCVVSHAARVRHLGAASSNDWTSFRHYIVNSFRFALKHLTGLRLLVAVQAIAWRAVLGKAKHGTAE